MGCNGVIRSSFPITVEDIMCLTINVNAQPTNAKLAFKVLAFHQGNFMSPFQTECTWRKNQIQYVSEGLLANNNLESNTVTHGLHVSTSYLSALAIMGTLAGHHNNSIFVMIDLDVDPNDCIAYGEWRFFDTVYKQQAVFSQVKPKSIMKIGTFKNVSNISYSEIKDMWEKSCVSE